jgi:hypothetical protein
MAQRTVVGVFDSVGAAERAKAWLTSFGVRAERIAVSGNLMEDGIAAEAPGQSYEHHSTGGSEGRDTDWARYNTAVRTGACLLSVSSGSGADRRRLAEVLLEQGARVALERPAP